jgi:hypothetical protein
LIVLQPALPAMLKTCRYNLFLCVQWASGILNNIVCESCWQTPSIQLVELNQLQEVIEFGHATVQRITHWISQWVKHLQKNKRQNKHSCHLLLKRLCQHQWYRWLHMEYVWNDNWEWTTCPSVTLSTTNPTRTSPGTHILWDLWCTKWY